MTHFASFAIGGFVPSAAIAGVLVLIGLGAFFYLGLKGPTAVSYTHLTLPTTPYV